MESILRLWNWPADPGIPPEKTYKSKKEPAAVSRQAPLDMELGPVYCMGDWTRSWLWVDWGRGMESITALISSLVSEPLIMII